MSSEKPYANLYCPYCYAQVNPDHGDHWEGGCEYERSIGDWINPQQPLTEAQVLDRKIAYVQTQLNTLLDAKEKTRKRYGLLS